MYKYKHFKTSKSAVVVVLIAFALVAWGIVAPVILAKKPEGKGNPKTVFEVEAVSDGGPYNSPTLVSTCSGSTDGKTLFVVWPRDAVCIRITPLGSSYELTDDPQLAVVQRKGKVVAVKFYIQDTEGPEGILHESERMSVTPPVEPSSSGFTLQIQQDDVPMYRLKGHVGGPRVEQIGTISVGDFVFTPVQ